MGKKRKRVKNVTENQPDNSKVITIMYWAVIGIFFVSGVSGFQFPPTSLERGLLLTISYSTIILLGFLFLINPSIIFQIKWPKVKKKDDSQIIIYRALGLVWILLGFFQIKQLW